MVLTDENLLLPLLYALPADIGRVNVTMGFPLRQSLAYTFVERLVELQNHRRKRAAAGPSTMPTWRVFWRIPMSPSATPR